MWIYAEWGGGREKLLWGSRVREGWWAAVAVKVVERGRGQPARVTLVARKGVNGAGAVDWQQPRHWEGAVMVDLPGAVRLQQAWARERWQHCIEQAWVLAASQPLATGRRNVRRRRSAKGARYSMRSKLVQILTRGAGG